MSVLPMMAAFYGLAFANIFLRSTMGVLAPELSVELDLSPAMLGAVASAYFVSYALMQIPSGLCLDRFGPHATVSAMFLLAVAGTYAFALAGSGTAMLLARVMMGAGCAGVFAAAFMVIGRFFPGDRFTSIGGTLNSFAMVGTLTATAPLAALVVWAGWRVSFALIAFAMAGIALLAMLSIRDYPAGTAHRYSPRAQSLPALLAGLGAVLRTPGIVPLAGAGIALSAGNTLLGIWGGPYLNDVHGLGEIERGTTLSAMAIAGVAGHFLVGHAARWLNTLKWIVVGSGAAIVLITATLAALPDPSVATVAALLAALGLACSFPTILLAHGRALVPEPLVGRGLTAVNTGIMLSIAAMQLAVGAVLGWSGRLLGSSDPALAYRSAFGFIAVMALLSMAFYLRTEDRPPR